MNIIHITNVNELSISNNQLIMIDEKDNDKKESKIALNDVLAIVIENCRCRISAVLQVRLSEKNIPLIICNERHQLVLQSLGLYNHYQVTMRINEQIKWGDLKKKNFGQR